MKGGVYLYSGDSWLTNGSFADLERLGIEPEEGLTLSFCDIDADDQNRPTYLCVKGTLRRGDNGVWLVDIDPTSFHSVLQVDADAVSEAGPSESPSP
jgi:hypothetical protein